ncbi:MULTISPECIES: streptolysin associated protein SagC [unclassified Borrelia]|uniref:streptolysin associated protein SagC n=1 Tax=unclassified Borrelia TaxID=2649934 RepID=UPI001E4501F3|nr:MULTISPECIES: streptolysin associated protein SagC [unclassified Borrelia]UGQ16588.1 streptolysin associated protein SagC [Borrelia sp. RT5S]UGQ17742.1 streptolysin associated protein SagC [Borrelia sp. RT1S]
MNNCLYYFSDDVRILKKTESVFVVRKGIWNYEDLIIDVEDSHVGELSKVFKALASDEGIDLIKIKSDKVKNIISELINSGFVDLNESQDSKKHLNYLYLGRYLERIPQHKPFLLIADNDNLINILESSSKAFELKYAFLKQKELKDLKTPIFLNKLDTVRYSKELDYFRSEFSPFEGIIILLSNVSPFLLRNINRILMELDKPVFLGMIDGPFMMITCLIPNRTACLECYEQRIVARMTDHVLYHSFNEEYKGYERDSGLTSLGVALGPAYHHIAYILVGDAFGFYQTKNSKLLGRALHIYVPCFEFQNQDVLRISSCTACGYISAYKSRCLNVETQRVVSNLISNSK